jgi:hypothetical protein
MTQETAKTVEILKDIDGLRIVRLDYHFSNYESEVLLAQLGEGLCTLTQMRSDHKPKNFTIDPQNMDRLTAAWLQFRADNLAREKTEQAEFQAQIDATRLRAIALGASMTLDMQYDTFTLIWPDNSPLEHFNTRWVCGNTNLSLDDAAHRLKCAEEHREKAQTEAMDDKHYISTFERQRDRAKAVGGYLTADADEHDERTRYLLTFTVEHPFFNFWAKGDELTPGLVEYRLRYVEGVMKTASK